MTRLHAVRSGAGYVARRLLSGLATLLLVTVLVFGAINLIPGSFVDIVLGESATPEARARLIAEYGLDAPLPIQYFHWLRHAVVGDLGASMQTGQPVAIVIADRLPLTLELALAATALALVVGIPLALVSGITRRRSVRQSSRVASAAAMSVPDFVLGSVLVYLFSRFALGLPVSGYVAWDVDPWAHIRAMILPVITLGVFGVALIARTGGDAVAEVMSAPHITASIARGESTWRITRHHVLRNISIPTLTVTATIFGGLMGGVVIAESLFSLPGLGQAVLQNVLARDYAVVQACVLVGAVAFIFVNMLTDVMYGFIDPRVRTGMTK